jgi:FkbM family methyltransferase
MSLPLQCIIAQNVHGLYCVPERSKQRPAAVEVLNGRVWESDTIALICRSAGAGDIVHAGTFFGDFLPAISAALAPAAKVWAFEPNSENFQAASITCRLNNLRNVELHHGGLSDRSTHRVLKVGQNGAAYGGVSHFLDRDAVAGENVEEISVETIDNVVPSDRPVSVVQLDVEHHERPALAGGWNTIAKWHPLVILETVPEVWVRQNLGPLGYRLIGQCHDNSVFAANAPNS